MAVPASAATPGVSPTPNSGPDMILGSTTGQPAVDPATHDVLVPDYGVGKANVDTFSSGGQNIPTQTNSAFLPVTPTAIAVDPGSGDVWLTDAGGCVNGPCSPPYVGLFDRHGSPVSISSSPLVDPTGIAIDPASGNVYVTDNNPSAPSVDVFQLSGGTITEVSSWTIDPSAGGADSIALAGGLAYVGTPTGVHVFTQSGTPQAVSGTWNSGEPANAVAIDPLSGDVFTADTAASVVNEFTPQGAPVTTYQGAPSSPAGIAFDPTTGSMYVSYNNGGSPEVLKFGRFGPLPTVSDVVATATSDATATIAGLVNPAGMNTQETVSYSPAGGSLASTATTGPNDSDVTTPFTVSLSSLTPGTTYDYTVTATRTVNNAAGPGCAGDTSGDCTSTVTSTGTFTTPDTQTGLTLSLPSATADAGMDTATATVTRAPGGGTVTFAANGGDLSPAAPLPSDTSVAATVASPEFPAPDTTTALSGAFSGFATFLPSTASESLSSDTSDTGTSTTLPSALPVSGQYQTITASVADLTGASTVGTGTVTFSVDGQQLTATDGAPLPVPVSGGSATSPQFLFSSPGIHTVTATYAGPGGSGTYLGSSTTETVQVLAPVPLTPQFSGGGGGGGGGSAVASSSSSAPSPSNPVVVTVTDPAGGPITFGSGTGLPAGWTGIGSDFLITAPASTAANPVQVTFTIDPSALTGGEPVDIFRNGAQVPACTAAAQSANPQQASPDPCALPSTTLSNGDVQITVLTSSLSLWAVAQPTPGTIAIACSGVTSNPFTDTAGDVGQQSAACLAAAGIADGVSATRFAPSLPVSRGEMAAFIARLLARSGVALPASPANPFTDVPAGGVFTTAIDQLAAVGVVKGVTSSTYQPDASVTREQMAAYLVRAYQLATGLQVPVTSDGFTDVPAGDVFASDIAQIAQIGVTRGTTASTYAPSSVVRRGEMALFLARLLSLFVANGNASPVS